MKKRTYIGMTLIFAVLLSGGALIAKETAVTRLENGVALMKGESKWKEAIREFESVLLAEGNSKKLAAEARYRIAKCYLELGEEAKAKVQVEKLKKNYSAENQWVTKASRLIGSGIPFGERPWEAGEFLEYRIQLPDGSKAGDFYIAIQESEFNGEKTWVTFTTRAGGNIMQTRADFLMEGYRPVQSKSYSNMLGSLELDWNADGSWAMRTLSNEKDEQKGDARPGGWEASPAYDNDQMIQLIRTLPTEVGTEVSIPLVAVLQGGHLLDFKVKAEAHETVKVPAGTFECVKFGTNIGQTLWVALEGTKPVVKMGMGNASIVLMDMDEKWDWMQPIELESEKVGGSVQIPAGAIYVWRKKSEKQYKARVTDGLYRFEIANIEVWDNSKWPEKEGKSARDLIEESAAEISKQASSFEMDEDAWAEVEWVDGLKATFARGVLKRGEIETVRTFVVSRGPAKTLVLGFDHVESKSEETVELMKEVFQSWKR